MKKKIILGTFTGLFLLMLSLYAYADQKIVKRGSCGENLTWTLSENGTLTISGTGNMYDVQLYSPWYSDKSMIQTAIIENGVANIGSTAFRDCSNLTSIDIPVSVTNIGDDAFIGCSSLTSIYIPNSVTNIGTGAFFDCNSLTSINIPDGITIIADSTFSYCSDLTNISIPDSVTSIGNSAFLGCYELTSITIPEGITSIADQTFQYCENLSSITIPNSITSIGDKAFYLCTDLTSIFIPDDLVYIGSDAFYSCNAIKYTTLGSEGAKTLSKNGYTFRVPNTKVDLIYLFSNNQITGLQVSGADKDSTSIVIPHNVTRIGEWAFSECSNLISITIPDSITDIGFAAFYGCSGLTNITIPDNVLNIGENAFSGCNNLTSVIIPDSVTSISSSTFYECSKLASVTLPTGLTNIGSMAFIRCSNLTSISIPDGVISIGDAAFDGCSKLINITIPDSVISIGRSSFSSCESLTSITIPNSVLNIGSGAFWNCNNLTNVSLSNGLTCINDNAFYGCIRLNSVTIPDSIQSIGNFAFPDSNVILYATIDSSGAKALSKAGFSFRVPDTKVDLIYLFSNEQITGLQVSGADKDIFSVVLPDSVTSIGPDAFSYCDNLISITINDGVTSIGNYAFSYCRNLKSIMIPDSVHTFGNYIFLSIKPTIYCYEYSDADVWSVNAGYPVVYLDNLDLVSIRTVNLSDDFRMSAGNTIPLDASVFPLSDKPSFSWSSNNTSVVSIDDDGIITAHAPGVATITLEVGTVSDSVNITVYLLADSFNISSPEIWQIAKIPIQLSLTDFEPEGSEASIIWSSSDTSYANIDTTGLVTTYKPGDIIISADSENGIHRECLLHICYPVTAIEFDQSDATVFPDFSWGAKANVTMRSQSCVNHLVSFTSSNPEIATINENGVIHGIKAGTTTITATADSGVTASMSIIVRDALVLLLPSGLTEIETEAFTGSACEVVIIPEGCSVIGEKAFSYCDKLVRVVIPSTVKSYPENAFEGCSEDLVIDWK